MEKKVLLYGLVEKGLVYPKAPDAATAGLYWSKDAWDDVMRVLQTRYP